VDSQPSIVVIGGASLDIKGRLRAPFRPGTSNAATIQISIGGVGRNIAENLVRLGTPTALIAAVCADDFGRAIVQHTADAGVDTSHMLVTCHQRSASYIAMLGHDGSLLGGLDDSNAARAIEPAHVQAHAALLRQAHMVVIDANLGRATAATVLDICEAAHVPVAFEPVAYGLAERFVDVLDRFCLVTPNELEAESLTGITVHDVASATAAAQRLVACGVEIALITLAHQGLVYATGDEVGHVPVPPTDIVDPTGAGDALTAAVIYGLTNDVPLSESIRLGQVAATLTLRSPETVAPELSLEYIYAQLDL
jgi:pseudouridine kinase